jgi:hypothetical protein
MQEIQVGVLDLTKEVIQEGRKSSVELPEPTLSPITPEMIAGKEPVVASSEKKNLIKEATTPENKALLEKLKGLTPGGSPNPMKDMILGLVNQGQEWMRPQLVAKLASDGMDKEEANKQVTLYFGKGGTMDPSIYNKIADYVATLQPPTRPPTSASDANPKLTAESSSGLTGCDCTECPKCNGNTVCAKCQQCARCGKHTEGCPGCSAGSITPEEKATALRDGLNQLRETFKDNPDKLSAINEAEAHLKEKGVL